MARGRVLLVDDDKNLLTALKRQLRTHFDAEVSASAQDALQLMHTAPFPVLVADMQMPHMNGVALLKEVKKHFPDTVRVMLTGNADQATAVSALNEGSIFRFINKPCSNEGLVNVLDQAFEYYRLITGEKELLQKTLAGSVKLVTDLLALTAPKEFGAVVQRRELVRKVSEKLHVTNIWEVELSFMLAPLLTHLVADDLHEKVLQGAPLSADDEKLINQTPAGVRRLIENVPRLKGVAELLEGIVPFDYTASAESRISHQQQLGVGTRIVQTLRDLTLREQRGGSLKDIITKMSSKQSVYDVSVVGAIAEHLGVFQSASTEKENTPEDGFEVSLKELCAGQKLLNKIETKEGKLLLSAGTILSGALIERISAYAAMSGLKNPIRVDAKMPVNE